MNRKALIAVVLGITVFGGSAVYAGWPTWSGCGWFGPATNVETLREFQSKTLAQRDELMVKQLELRQEHAKVNPDQERLAALQKKADELQAGIQSAADKYGLAGGMMPCGMQGKGMQHGPMSGMHQGMMAQGMKAGSTMCGCGMRSM